MIAFSKIDDLNKVIRAVLISQSQLQPDRVLNSLSVHGEDLDKLIEEQVYESIDVSDTMLLFELRSRESTSDMSQTLEDGTILTIRSFTLFCMLYGSSSSDLATVLQARLLSEELIESLRTSGVYIEEVSKPTILNEYKNNTMWLRNDISVNVSCKFIIQKITIDNNFIDLTTTQIENYKED